MTDYQKAVAEHMATAPEDLNRYVCERLKEKEGYKKGWHPISAWVIDSLGSISSEERIFWHQVSEKNWKLALWSGFWQWHTQQQGPDEPSVEDVFSFPSLDRKWKRMNRRVTDQKPEEYDFVNPDHYKQFSIETIDMMVAIWGKEATALHCEMCAFKYRIRMGVKPDQPIERDLEKVNWYMAKAKELRS